MGDKCLAGGAAFLCAYLMLLYNFGAPHPCNTTPLSHKPTCV